MNAAFKIVANGDKYKKVSLIEPSAHAYLHLAAEVDRSVLPVFLTTSKKKAELLALARAWCHSIRQEPGIFSAAVFTATVIPPGGGSSPVEPVKPAGARYDFSILVEAGNHALIDDLTASDAYKALLEAINSVSDNVHVWKARNVRRMADVDHSRPGVFLFNYFSAAEVEQNIQVWAYTAGWFQQKTGLDNSTVLAPYGASGSPYALVNHCRWDHLWQVLPSLLFRPSFRSFVLKNFYANAVVPMPVLYKMV